MIYTVTFNPSLDYVVQVDDFSQGVINRTEYEEILEGGKGINVSLVLNNLGIDNVALGFIAGFTGDEIERRVISHGCKTDLIRISKGLSRINVKLKSRVESEINGQGPIIEERDLEILYHKLDKIKENDILVLSGSIPSSLPEDVYERILKCLESKNILVVVDAAKDLLKSILKYQPFLVKPNHHELGELYGVKLKTYEDVLKYGIKLQEEGARNVLVSMAGDGAVFISESGTNYVRKAPIGEVINSVGAGDSMVAGFLTGFVTYKNYEVAFNMGIAAGSATAFSPRLATKEEVEKIYGKLKKQVPKPNKNLAFNKVKHYL